MVGALMHEKQARIRIAVTPRVKHGERGNSSPEQQ